MIHISHSQGTIDNVSITGEKLSVAEWLSGLFTGSALYVKHSKVTIFNTVFENLTGSDWGGAVCLWEFSDVILDNCKFINNTAKVGGAISIEATEKVILKDNLYLKNKAVFYKTDTDKFCCAAGAIFIWNDHRKPNCKNGCPTIFQGVNNFTKNFAKNEGSAVTFFS